MRFSCKHCGKAYKLSSKYEGKKLRCKKCQSVFRARSEEDVDVVAEVVDDFDLPVAQEAVPTFAQPAAQPLHSFPSRQPQKPKPASRRDQLAGAKRQAQAQRSGDDGGGDYALQIGWTLILMGISTNIAHMFGYVLRRLRFLGEYAPVAGLVLIFIGALILVFVYQQRDPLKGAICVVLSLAIGLGAFTINVVRGLGGVPVHADSGLVTDRGPTSRMGVTSNRGKKERIELPPSTTYMPPLEDPYEKPLPGRSTGPNRKGIGRSKRGRPQTTPKLRPPSTPSSGNPFTRPHEDERQSHLDDFDDFGDEFGSLQRETPERFKFEVERHTAEMDQRRQEIELLHKIKKRNSDIQRKMDKAFGSRYRREFPEKMLSESIGKDFGRPRIYIAPEKEMLFGLAVIPKTRLGSRQISIGDVTPLYESDVENNDPIVEKGVIALEGYAVYSVSVIKNSDGISGMQVTFAKFSGGKYDVDDSYESDWLINEPRNEKVTTLGGTGDPVIGVFSSAGLALSSFGLVLDR